MGRPVAGSTGLDRPRLVSTLDKIMTGRLGLVSGPPGSGKTTLLAQWAAATDATVAWCRPDVPDRGRGVLHEGLHSAVVAVTGKTGPGHSDGLVVIVDEADRFTETSGVEGLAQFLSEAPSHIKVLLAGCGRPSLNMAKSEFPTALSISADDLRFRGYEVESLFRTFYGQPLSCPGALNVARQTDGWAAALQLFHLSVKERSSSERCRRAESLRAVTGFMRDYVSDHVLSRLTDDQADFLQAVAVFEEMTVERCNALLGTDDSWQHLHELERRGFLLGGEDGRTYRMAFVLQRYFRSRSQPHRPADHGRLPAAEVLDHEGDHAGAMAVRARAGDWEGIRRSFRTVGSKAIVPGRCGWSATTPAELDSSDPWLAVASARRLLDDGDHAAAAQAARGALALADTSDCIELAGRMHHHAALWSGDSDCMPSQCRQADILFDTVRSGAAGAGRPPTTDGQAGGLAVGLALLLAGDQRSALPVLRRCANGEDKTCAEALAARLTLACIGAMPSESSSSATEAEFDAIARAADHRGLTWLSRLAQGMGATSSSHPQSRQSAILIADWCQAKGDEWGAALIHTARALLTMRSGQACPTDLQDLAVRFRSLGASVPEAWARSACALTASVAGAPGWSEAADEAAAFARRTKVPGALAVARAAQARQGRDTFVERTTSATGTATVAELVCFPWTGFLPPRSAPILHSADEPMRTSAAVEPRFAVSVRCFGGFALGISDSEVELSHLRPQARTVLRVLATHAGRPVHRDRLACALWNDTDPLPTLHHLQVHISNLRKLAPRRPDGSHHPFIVRVGETYALAVDGRGACDLSDFDAHFQGALRAQASGDIEHAAHCLQRGVDLYRGEVLPEDGDAEWVSEVRDRYRLRAAEAACLLAQSELILGRTTAAAAAATRSIEIDPWRDESWRTLMAIHRSTGDIMSAERAQQRYEQMLASLSVHPGTTTPVSRPDPAAGAVPAATALPGHAPMHLWKRP